MPTIKANKGLLYSGIGMNILTPVRRAIGSLIGFASNYIITPIKTLWGRLVSSLSSTQRNIPTPDDQSHMRSRKVLRRRSAKRRSPIKTIVRHPQATLRKQTKPTPPAFDVPQPHWQELTDHRESPQHSHPRKRSEDNLFIPAKGGLAASSSPLQENEGARDIISFNENSLPEPSQTPSTELSHQQPGEPEEKPGSPSSKEDIGSVGSMKPHIFTRQHLSSTNSMTSNSASSQGYEPEDHGFTSDESDTDVFSSLSTPVPHPVQLNNASLFQNHLTTQRSTSSSTTEGEDSSPEYSEDYRANNESGDSDLEARHLTSLNTHQDIPKPARTLSYSTDEELDCSLKQDKKKKNHPPYSLRSNSVPVSSEKEKQVTSNESDLLTSLNGLSRPVRNIVHQELRMELDEIKELSEKDERDLQLLIDEIAIHSLGPEMLKSLAEEGLVSIDKDELINTDSESSSDEEPPLDLEKSIKVHLVTIDRHENDSGLESESCLDTEDELPEHKDVRVEFGKSGNIEDLIIKHSKSIEKILKTHNVPKTQWESVKQRIFYDLESGDITKNELIAITVRHAENHTSSAEMMMSNTVSLLGKRKPKQAILPEDILVLKNRLPHEGAPVTNGDIAALNTLVERTTSAVVCCEYNPHTGSHGNKTIGQQIADTKAVLSQVNQDLEEFHDIDSGQSRFWGGDCELEDHYLIKQNVQADLLQMKLKLEQKINALNIAQAGDFRQLEKVTPSVELIETVALRSLDKKIHITEQELNALRVGIDKHTRLSPQWSAAKIAISLKKALLKKLNEAKGVIISAKGEIDLKPNNDGIVVDAVKQLKKYEKIITDTMKSVDLKKIYKLNITQELNETYTDSIEEDIPLQVDGVFHQIHTEAKPAHAIRFTLEGEDGGHEPHLKPYGGTIRNSATKDDADHARNFYIQTTTDKNGKVIERVTRLGIPTRFFDKKIRREDIKTVWKEVFVSQICETHSDIPGFKEAIDKGPEHAVSLPLSYTCLLSPDMFRKITGLHENEHLMAEEAIGTLMEMADKPIELDIRESHGKIHKIWVKPDPVALIMPLNQLAFSDTKKHLLGTFMLADKYNKRAAIQLFGDFGRKNKKGRKTTELAGSVGQFLKDNPKISPIEREQIFQISTEMARVIHNKLYHKGGARPNYLGWLLQELCRLTGRNYVVGCKSGKDRTGNFCTANTVESAESYFRLEAADKREGQIPRMAEVMNFGTDLKTSERVLNMNTALFLSPSIGITRTCVGFPGLKCDDTALGVNTPLLVYVQN